ncbi:hypothetical protein Tco_0744891 [Tanacetum coccineum]
MMVQAPEDMGEDSAALTDSYSTPIITQPSSFKPQNKKSKRKQRKDSGPTEPIPDEATNEEPISTPSCDPPQSGEDRLQLTELMNLCTKLQKQVLDLEEAKTAQAKEIASLKKRDDASKQGRKITGLDANEEVTLIDETQERNDEDLMFDTDVLNGDEVFEELIVNAAKITSSFPVSAIDPVTTAGEVVTTASATTTMDELTLAQTLIEIKAAKPKAVTTSAITITIVVASTRPKAKGIVFHDQEEQASAFTSIVSSSQLPQSKGKGKGKMVEPEKPLKKKDQIALDKELAHLEAQLEAELIEEERLAMQKEEEANIALIESWDNTQAMMEADFEVALEGEEDSKKDLQSAKEKLNVYLFEEYGWIQTYETRTEESSKKAGDELESDMSKKQKINEHVEVEKHATKPPVIVEYKIDKDGKMGYFKLIRADGSSKRMDDPSMTMEEYIKFEEEKACKRGKVFNWQTATYGKIRVDDDLHNLSSLVSTRINDEFDFRISFDESDDEDYTIIWDTNTFSYKMISVNNLKTDSENDYEKVMPSIPSPKPVISCFDDLDFFNDFENEFPVIVYNDAQTSKLDLLTEPILSPQHIDEFNDKTSLSEYDEEEQNVLYFNDLFPFNIICSDDLKSEKDNDNDKINIIQSLENNESTHGSNTLFETSHDKNTKDVRTRRLEKSIDQSDLECCESTSSNDKNGSDSKNLTRHIDSINTPANEIDEKKPELKNLPQHLEYAYLHGEKSFPIIISSELSKNEKTSLLQVLERRKGAIACKMSDIKGISLSYCTHKILMMDDYKPVIQPQRRLNLKVHDVVKNKIVKLLDSGLIYPISDSSWVIPIHVVPKKGGITVVLNDNNELIPSRIVTGWRVCIDYRKLKDATRKDHFPLPFIDQMLERLCGNEYYYFLDGFWNSSKLPSLGRINEKNPFTCPYGTFRLTDE